MTALPAGTSRLLHTMLRVQDLERSIDFYCGQLGMQVLRRRDYPGGRFTLAFLGYGAEATTTVLELTHNWDRSACEPGSGFGHLAIAVEDVFAACAAMAASGVTVTRHAGPMKHDASEVIAFIQDPDGYAIELIQQTPTPGAHLSI